MPADGAAVGRSAVQQTAVIKQIEASDVDDVEIHITNGDIEEGEEEEEDDTHKGRFSLVLS